jgi:hypothetical protein
MPSMIVNKKFIPTLKKAMFAATDVLALMQCSEEEEFVTPAATDAAIEAASTTGELSVQSLTVTGSNTAFTNLNDCKTCTYIVSEKEEIVDGSVLGFKPGNIICLNKGIKYGNLEFVNIEGSVESPIVIATIGAQKPAVAEVSSVANPY